MNNNFDQKTPLEKLLILGGGIWLAAKILDEVFPAHDTVNYTLYHKKQKVYHGIAFADRLDARLNEHEANGKTFDNCIYDDAKPRVKALNIERKRIRRDRTFYNKQHNSF